MQGGVKTGTPKSRSVGKFLFCVGTKNVSVIKKDRRCLLQFSFCPLGHEKWTDFAQHACLRDPNFQNLIFLEKKIALMQRHAPGTQMA